MSGAHTEKVTSCWLYRWVMCRDYTQVWYLPLGPSMAAYLTREGTHSVAS